MSEGLTHLWKGSADRLITPHEAPATDNVREFWLATRRQVWVVLVCALAGLALGAFHFATSPARYYASSTILIEEIESDLDQEMSSLRPLTRNDTAFQNQFQILRSRHLATEVVRDLNLHETPAFTHPPRSVLGQAKSDLAARLKSLLPRPAPVAEGGPASEPDDSGVIEETAALLVERTDFIRLGKSYSVQIGFLSHDPDLAAQIADAYARAYLADGAQANLAASETTAAWMEERIAEVRSAASAASDEAERFRAENRATDQQGLREREQRIGALNELLIGLEARYQEHLLARSYPVPNGRVLSTARVPDTPAKPVAWQLLLAGLAAGAILGLGLAVLRELREIGFRTGDDIRALGLDFLGYLPVLRARDRKDRRTAAPAGALLLATQDETREVAVASGGGGRRRISLGVPQSLTTVADDMTVAESDAPYGRAARGMLWSIDMAGTDGKASVLGVTGLSRGEGATTLASNLAEQAVENGGRVLLIDGDFGGGGLSAQISTGEKAKAPANGNQPTGQVRRLRSNVHVLGLPGGAVPVSSSVTAIRAAIADAAHLYDLIVIDMPPVTHPDAASLTRLVDGVVLVLRWGHTTRRSVEAHFGRASPFRRKTVGAVLNRTRLDRLGRYGVPREASEALLAT